MRTKLYKLISFIVKSIIFLVVLVHLALYGWYRYELRSIDLSLYSEKQENYNTDYYTVLWADGTGHKNVLYTKGIEMKPMYPLYDILLYSHHHMPHPSYGIVSFVASNNLPYHVKRVKKYMLQIWISHHLTFEETANLYFDKSYYGHRFYGLKSASKGYFGKEPNELTLYQIMMLVVLANNSNLDPTRHPNKLITKMMRLNYKLKTIFPDYYPKKSDYKEIILSGIISLTVENSLEFMKNSR